MTIIAPGAVLPTMEPLFSPRGSAATDKGFRIPAASNVADQAAAGQARAAPSTTATSAMLALQEQVGSEVLYESNLMDREARRHGQEILDALIALQRTLLASADTAGSLARLAALTESDPAVRDPPLARALASIRLRARLEVLRRTPRLQDPDHGSAAAAIMVSVTGS